MLVDPNRCITVRGGALCGNALQSGGVGGERSYHLWLVQLKREISNGSCHHCAPLSWYVGENSAHSATKLHRRLMLRPLIIVARSKFVEQTAIRITQFDRDTKKGQKSAQNNAAVGASHSTFMCCKAVAQRIYVLVCGIRTMAIAFFLFFWFFPKTMTKHRMAEKRQRTVITIPNRHIVEWSIIHSAHLRTHIPKTQNLI